MLKSLRFLPKRETNFQIMYATIAGLAMVGPGMGIAYPSVSLPRLTNATFGFSLNKETAALFASIPSITAPLGCAAGILTMKYGRRFAILISSSAYALSWMVIATSSSSLQLLAGRVIQGIASGLAVTPTSVYISEISSVNLAAILNAATCLYVSTGYEVIYLLGYFTQGDWKLSAMISTLVPISSILGTLFILPESPRWLLIRNKREAARNSLLRLRGLKTESPKFQTEFGEMVAYSELKYDLQLKQNELESIIIPEPQANNYARQKPVSKDPNLEDVEKKKQLGICNLLLSKLRLLRRILKIPEVWKPFVILNTFFLLQEFSGVTVVVPYAVDIVTKAGVAKNPYLVSVVMGLLQVSSDATFTFCSSRIGRRHIGIISAVGTSLSLVVLGIYNQFFEFTQMTAIPLSAVLTFVILGSIGLGNLPWAMIGELYPTRFVNILAPLTTFSQGLYDFASLQLYPTFVELDFCATLYFYSAVAALSTLFIVFVLPETRGKSKAEVEAEFNK